MERRRNAQVNERLDAKRYGNFENKRLGDEDS
jgi:hypothetical protein